MVIADFDIPGVCPGPTETNAPLIVDADGMLAETVSFECFETVPRWDCQVREDDGFVDLDELADGRTSDGAVDPGLAGFVERFGLTILE